MQMMDDCKTVSPRLEVRRRNQQEVLNELIKEKQATSPKRSRKKKKTKYGNRKRIRFWARRNKLFDPLLAEVPPIVEDSIAFLEANDGISAEGIFRRAGSHVTAKTVKAKYEKGKKVDLEKETGDSHTVAGILILFFRTLPNPLLTYELYDCFRAACNVGDTQTRVQSIRQCVDLLPAGNRAVLVRLIRFLQMVIANKDVNKMGTQNLAIVFAPTMLRPEGEKESMASILGDSMHSHRLMEAFIENFSAIFDGETPPQQDRCSMSPEERAAFFRTLKRGTIRLASAMVEADELAAALEAEGEAMQLEGELGSDPSTSEGSTSSSEGEAANAATGALQVRYNGHPSRPFAFPPCKLESKFYRTTPVEGGRRGSDADVPPHLSTDEKVDLQEQKKHILDAKAMYNKGQHRGKSHRSKSHHRRRHHHHRHVHQRATTVGNPTPDLDVLVRKVCSGDLDQLGDYLKNLDRASKSNERLLHLLDAKMKDIDRGLGHS